MKSNQLKPWMLSMFGLLLLSATLLVNAQERLVSGKVTDATNGTPIPGVSVVIKGTTTGTATDQQGRYQLNVNGYQTLVFTAIGFGPKEVKTFALTKINVQLSPGTNKLEEVVATKPKKEGKKVYSEAVMTPAYQPSVLMPAPSGTAGRVAYDSKPFDTEDYSAIHENGFQETRNQPLTTFSIDVDRASYSNARRFLNNGSLPPKDAVRIEEFINYFDYHYPQPTGKDPVAMVTELSDSPWNKGLKLLHVGLQAKTIATDNLPPSNLVFLIDVSGSMADPNKLPLIKAGFKLLVDQLRPQDRVAIVVYAGAAGLVLPSTPGNEKNQIKDALDRLEAGGSTAGGAGIKLAYQVAIENFRKNGNNRVILATDGDFNVGVSSDAELQRLIEQKRESGVFLSVLGCGMGNYKDNKMETLADKGNGNFAYIDNLLEAEKVFVKEFGGTLFTVAKDVKVQIEFNPKYVKAYRLIGYENRMLKNEEFNDDKKDAGEMGSGHTVTALYEIVPAGVESAYLANVDALKYQQVQETQATHSGEILTLKVRYKDPDGDKSRLIEKAVMDNHTALASTSTNFRFAAAVAEFGLLLRNSEFKGSAHFDQVLALAKEAQGSDSEGYRAEFLKLVKTAKLLSNPTEEARKE
ncbi:MAG: von Willebrand factor type A domain-containing protein [Spirosomataceae bacterium]